MCHGAPHRLASHNFFATLAYMKNKPHPTRHASRLLIANCAHRFTPPPTTRLVSPHSRAGASTVRSTVTITTPTPDALSFTPIPFPTSSAPRVRFSHSLGRSLRSLGSSVLESGALKLRPKNPNDQSTYTRADRALTPDQSQRATTGGPLKTRGPLSSSPIPSPVQLLNSPALSATLVNTLKTKGAQGLIESL